MSVVLFTILFIIALSFTEAGIVISHLLFHLPRFPFWLNWAIGLGLLSWLLGD